MVTGVSIWTPIQSTEFLSIEIGAPRHCSSRMCFSSHLNAPTTQNTSLICWSGCIHAGKRACLGASQQARRCRRRTRFEAGCDSPIRKAFLCETLFRPDRETELESRASPCRAALRPRRGSFPNRVAKRGKRNRSGTCRKDGGIHTEDFDARRKIGIGVSRTRRIAASPAHEISLAMMWSDGYSPA
jgi:hypothetical protein